MELSLRLDTLGMVEMRYLRHRERFRDWPSFQLLAASRQAKVMAYLSKDVAEQLHQQILIVETAVGLDEDDEDELDDDSNSDELNGGSEGAKSTERDTPNFSPAFAQALERLNDLARQRLPEGTSGSAGSEQPVQSGALPVEGASGSEDDDDALEQLQDAFVQMMEVVRELAEELSTDALKISGRFRCARTNIEFIQAVAEDDDEDDEVVGGGESGVMEVEVEVELVMVLQLFEEGRSRPDDLPAVELQLDVDDFERLHETLDYALQQEERSRRRK